MKSLLLIFSILLSSPKPFLKPQTQFQKVVFFNNITITLPSDLTPLTQDEIEAVTPAGRRKPNFIYRNQDTRAKFALTYGVNSGTDNDLPKFKALFEKTFTSSVSKVISSEYRFVRKKKFALLKVESTINSDVEFFNFFFITIIDRKLFLADFAVPLDKQPDYEKQEEDILNSIIIKN